MEPSTGIWMKIVSIFEKISFWAILIATALMPILFVPSYFFPAQNVRAFLFVGVAAFSLFTMLLKFIVEGKITVQKSFATWTFVILALVAVISSYFSGAFGASFIGDGGDIGASSFLLAFAAILLSMPQFFAEKRKIFYFYFAFLASFVILALFHILRLAFGASFLSFGILTDPASTIAGNWNDIAIFSGLAALFSVIGLETKAFGGFLRGILYGVFPASLILLAVVNFSIGWVILAVLSLVLSLYFYFSGSMQADGVTRVRSIPLVSLILLIVSLGFIFAGSILGGAISSHFGIFQIEAHPLWSTTIAIAKPVIASAPLLGVGPNRFSYVWQVLKPVGVNASPFWATVFMFGVGIIPTSIITMGILGTALFLLFLVLYLWGGIRAVRSLRGRSDLSRFALLSSFVCSLFLWIVAFVYVPGLPAFAVAAFWTAIFFAALQSEGLAMPAELSFDRSRIAKYVLSAVFVLVMVGSIAIALSYGEKTLAAGYLQRSIYAQSVEGNTPAAIGYINRALQFSQTPLLYRALIALDTAKLGNILSSAANVKAGDTKSADALKSQFTSVLGEALATARGNSVGLAAGVQPKNCAICDDSADSRNWVSLGSIYETLLPINFPNAYENANAAYARAQGLNPANPEMYLDLARVEFAHATTTASTKAYISKALALKGDYVAGIYFLSQVQISDKDYAGATKSLVAAANINPNDQAVLYRLGAVAYSTGDYATAAAALGRAVTNDPTYANAIYLLGLTYDKLGKSSDALAEFKALLKIAPDNANVKAIIANLEAGLPAAGKAAATLPKAATTNVKKK